MCAIGVDLLPELPALAPTDPNALKPVVGQATEAGRRLGGTSILGGSGIYAETIPGALLLVTIAALTPPAACPEFLQVQAATLGRVRCT